MEFNFSKRCKPKKYKSPSPGLTRVRRGVLYFCGEPPSYVSYNLVNPKKFMPTLYEAQLCPKSIARVCDSFRPSMFKHLDVSEVHPSKFVFDRKTGDLLSIRVYEDVDFQMERCEFFYTPNIK